MEKSIYELGQELATAQKELFNCLFGPLLKFLERLMK